MSAPATDRYVPAAGHAAFTRGYDAVLALTMRESRWRPVFAGQVLDGLRQAGTVVEVGSGTGTLAIALAQLRRDATVIGIDGDPEVQALATRKPGADAVSWREGLAGQLALPDASVDRVVMSLLLHHLDGEGKREALREARRVLRPGGRLHIADWGRAHDPIMRAAFYVLQLIDGFDGTRDHASGRLPAIVEDAGFAAVHTHKRMRTTWGSLELMQAQRLSGQEEG